MVNREREVLTSWTRGSYLERRMTIQVEGTARVQIGKLTRRRNVVCSGAKTSCTVIVRCQTAQTCCFRPASCSSLSSCSGLQVPCTYSGQSTLPGVGPKCGIEAVAWVGEKNSVEISYRHKDLCSWCYSGGEGKAAGKRAAIGGLWENLGPCRSWSSLDMKIFRL